MGEGPHSRRRRTGTLTGQPRSTPAASGRSGSWRPPPLNHRELTPPGGLPATGPASKRRNSTGRFRSVVPPDMGLVQPASRVLRDLVRLEPNERMLIVHDDANEPIAYAFELAAAQARGFAERLHIPPTDRPLRGLSDEVLWSLREATVSVLAVSELAGETDFRRQFVTSAERHGLRHLHLVGISRAAFVGALSAEPPQILEHMRQLREQLVETRTVHVRSLHGTDLTIEVSPRYRWFDNGMVMRRGQWMNVPYGSVSTCPSSADGTYIADASMGGHDGAAAGRLTGNPVKLTIERGAVTHVSGSPSLVRVVEDFIERNPNAARVGLATVGANLGATMPLGEIVHDQTTPGVHLSLGDSFPTATGAEWSCPMQLSFAMADADVDLDDRPLIRRGRFTT